MINVKRGSVAVVAACVLVAPFAGCSSRSHTGPGSAPASPGVSSVVIDTEGDLTFYPAHQPAADALTPAQAWGNYQGQTRGRQPTVSEDLQVKYGTATLAAQFTNRPVWAFVLPDIGCSSPNPAYSIPPSGCNEWTMLDAMTGSFVVQTLQNR